MLLKRLLRSRVELLSCRQRQFGKSNMDYVQERFPYVLGNNLPTLVQTRETTNRQLLLLSNQFIKKENLKIEQGFYLAYKCLLECLANDDRTMLEEICEGNLYSKFATALDSLKENNLQLKLVNLEKHSGKSRKYELGVVDFQNFAGARIDRAMNRENGLKETSPFWVNLPNITVYMPSNPFKMTASFLGGSDPH